MVTPETLNALEDVKLISFCNLSLLHSQICFFLSFCHAYLCHVLAGRCMRETPYRSLAHTTSRSLNSHHFPTIHSICLYSFWRNSSVFLYCHVSDGNKTDIGSLLVVYSFRLYLFSFFLQSFSSVCHLKQYFPAFLNLFTPGVPLVRSMHGLQSWNILL